MPMKQPHQFAGLVPTDLIDAVRERRCILFAGAGLSAQAATDEGVHLPTWIGLLQQVVEWCNDHRIDLRVPTSELLELIERKRLLVVAQELQERLGDRLNACLSDILKSGRITPSESHLMIPESEWVAVLTSNYDSLIEGAYALRSKGVLPPVFSRRGIGSALDALRNRRFFILKLHGDLNDPGSIILGDRDYGRLLYLDPGYRAYLETLFASYTVLFVGFGGDDPDLNAVTDRLSAVYERSIGQHYLLIPSDVFAPIERRRLLEDKRLDCITYEKDEKHSQVFEFLKAVSYRSRPDTPPLSPFGTAKKRPRVFISASYARLDLAKQVSETLSKAGFDEWFADRRIKPGDSIVDEISQAIADSDCMVIILSEEAAQSQWIAFEAQRALAARKTLIPLRVGDAPVPQTLMDVMYLQINESGLTDSDKERLVAAVTRAVGRTQDEFG
jgi:hypothetical protein